MLKKLREATKKAAEVVDAVERGEIKPAPYNKYTDVNYYSRLGEDLRQETYRRHNK